MKMEKVSSVKEYIERIEQIREQNKLGHSLVFRGQGNSSWEIKSSLERDLEKTGIKSDFFFLKDYLKLKCLVIFIHG